MTTIPSPLSPATSLTLKYDAWNRLVEVKDGGNVVQTNKYDGLNRRIVKVTASETRHYYYTDQWQVIEEQVGATAATARPDVEYVWGPQYVDDLVVRYRDADASGTYSAPSLEEELYSLAGANFNVTAVTNSSGAIQERFNYTPYGESTVLASNFSPLVSSAFAWTHRYTTRELDLETGLQLNRNRFYHQQLGKWVSRDPIGYEGRTWNLYEYAKSGSLNYMDPSGLRYGRCVQLPQRCTSTRVVWIGLFKVTICVHRKCKWRCYCAGEDNCPRIPCPDRKCPRNHGVEEAGEYGPDPRLPLGAAPFCKDRVGGIIAGGDCPFDPPMI